jgi:diguanylate cyclase (GGDEF)-like protein
MMYDADEDRDSLTGLLSRRGWESRIAAAIAASWGEGHLVGLLLIDIDRFRDLNATLGHDAGDQFLQVLAQRLQACTRPEDTAIRYGGQEFALLLARVQSRQEAIQRAEHILRVSAEPVLLAGTPSHRTVSIGLAVYPMDAMDAEGLLMRADQALYAVKEVGGNRVHWWPWSGQFS